MPRTPRLRVESATGARALRDTARMALRRVRYEEDDRVYRIEGGGEIGFTNDDLVMPFDAVAEVSVAHFERALRRSEEVYGEHVSAIFISATPSAEFDKGPVYRTCWLGYSRGELTVEATFSVDADSIPRAPEVGALVAPLLARHRARWDGMWNDDQGGPLIGVSARLKGGRRSLGELYELGIELQLLLDAAGGATGLTARTAADLVRATRLDVIRGQPESIWLDAKGAPYVLGTAQQAWELAKDVVAFANTGSEALILLGMETTATPNGDVLDKPRPFAIAKMDVVALRAVLRDRITPAIPDLDVGVVESRPGSGYGFGWIFIPAQPQELQPFIVAGALIGDDWRGGHLSIPIRNGEDTVYQDAAAVHSMLAAGRIALRQAPPSRTSGGIETGTPEQR